MPEIVITVDKVHEALLCLNVNSAVGPDDVATSTCVEMLCGSNGSSLRP